MGSIFAQIVNAILAASSIGIARACGADAQTAIAIGTIIGTTSGNTVSGIIDLTTKKKHDNVFNIDNYVRSTQ